MASSTLLEVRDLSVVLRRSGRRAVPVHAVSKVSFDIERGSILALVGESGCGKTTIARTIAGLNREASGSICLDGVELVGASDQTWRSIRPRIQMVFQDPYSSLNPRWTASKLVHEPLARLGRARGMHSSEHELLGHVGITGSLKSRRPRDLSGGQRQRVVIARALATAPDLLVCDEPVSALDVSVQAQVLALLEELRRSRDLTCVYISHNLATVRWLADQVGVMYAGRLVELGPVEAVLERPLHPYTAALSSATLTSDPMSQSSRKPIVLSGDPPRADELGAAEGCGFRRRCWLYKTLGAPERCRTEPTPKVLTPHESACHFAGSVEDALVERTQRA